MQFREEDFPNLDADNHRDTSLPDGLYNCIAWAAGIDNDWWDPARKHFWPANVPRDYKVTSLILAYESVGFVLCGDDSQEEGFEKVAIYAIDNEYTHAALQLESGKWTSKMGPDEDIEHDTPHNLAGPCFGQVTAFMKRKRPVETE